MCGGCDSIFEWRHYEPEKLIGSFNLKKFSKASRTDFGVLKVARVQAEEEQWLQLAPTFQPACVHRVRNRTVELVSRDFVRRVEDLIAQYGDSAAAMKELADLIAG